MYSPKDLEEIIKAFAGEPADIPPLLPKHLPSPTNAQVIASYVDSVASGLVFHENKPINPEAGDCFFNTTVMQTEIFDGGKWVVFAGVGIDKPPVVEDAKPLWQGYADEEIAINEPVFKIL